MLNSPCWYEKAVVVLMSDCENQAVLDLNNKQLVWFRSWFGVSEWRLRATTLVGVVRPLGRVGRRGACGGRRAGWRLVQPRVARHPPRRGLQPRRAAAAAQRPLEGAGAARRRPQQLALAIRRCAPYEQPPGWGWPRKQLSQSHLFYFKILASTAVIAKQYLLKMFAT